MSESQRFILPKYLTKEIAQRAAAIAIHATMSDGAGLGDLIPKNKGHIVVLVPAMLAETTNQLFRPPALLDYEREIAGLKEAKGKAVAAEDFEGAATIQSQIDRLKLRDDALPLYKRGHSDYLSPTLFPFLLYEESLGDIATWEYPYDDIARCKSMQLWNDRNDDRAGVIPHMLFPNDTVYWGGVKRDGIVVGFSAADEWFDKLISSITLDTIVALCRHAFEKDEKRKTADFLSA